MRVALQPKTFFIAALLVVVVPAAYWAVTMYRTADLLSSLGTVEETFGDKLTIAWHLFGNAFQDSPISYLAPFVPALVLVILGYRRR